MAGRSFEIAIARREKMGTKTNVKCESLERLLSWKTYWFMNLWSSTPVTVRVFYSIAWLSQGPLMPHIIVVVASSLPGF
jgi:hypothetical protein